MSTASAPSPATSEPSQPVPAIPAETSIWESPWILWPSAAVLAVLLYWGLGHLALALTHETTDDAFIEAQIVSVAPKVSGHIATVLVKDNQMVQAGDLLATIDPRDYQIRLEQKRASADTSQANLKTVLSVLELMTAKVTTAEASAKQAHAQTDASRATAVNAQATLDRDTTLLQSGTISQQAYDDDKAAADAAAANLKAAEENGALQDSKVVEAKAQWGAATAAVSLARAQINQSDTDIDAAKLDLSYVQLKAPCAGYVTRKSVEPGNYVQVGQSLLAIVPTNVWVVANFKETQLTEMVSNQPARILIEAYPGKEFRGHVDSIQAGSGARFSLLPPENAVGNFVKVVQRVPVKILFDEPLTPAGVVGPGMSVLPSVQVKTYTVPKIVLLVVAVGLAALGATVAQILIIRLHHKLKQ
ncbi:MAG TPA: HlyD family secretion protein [Dongiaceae bacterium]|nr:HlyD family secretion protein [Dongiaceae bacterium]